MAILDSPIKLKLSKAHKTKSPFREISLDLVYRRGGKGRKKMFINLV